MNRPPEALTNEPRSSPPGWVRACLLVMIVAKFVLVSHEEIEARWFDDFGFAEAASRSYWGAKYDEYSYVKPPVYPLFVSGTTVLGLPTRLAQEAMWALACWALAAAVWRCGLGWAAGLAAGGLALFHPWSIGVMNRLLLDALYAPLFTLMLAVMCAGLAATSKRELRRWGILTAASAALAANTREESELVHVALLLGAMVALVCWWRGWVVRRLAVWRLTAVVLVPWLCVIVLTQVICAANYARTGAWMTHDLRLAGLTRLYNALLAIPPKERRLNIPIPKDVRERAYAASPALSPLKAVLEERPREEFLKACKNATGVEGEYGAWTIWALRDAAWHLPAEPWKSAKELDAFFDQGAEELRDAMSRGALESRAVPLSFVPPEWGLMMRAAPGTFGRCVGMMMNPRYQRERVTGVRGPGLETFDSVANRRIGPAKIARGEEALSAGWQRPGNVESLDRIKENLGVLIGATLRVGAWAGGLGLLLSVVFVRRGWLWPGYYVLVTILGAALLARLGLVVLLDMGGIGAQVRYLLPVVPALIALEIAGVVALGRVAVGLKDWSGRAAKEQAYIEAQQSGRPVPTPPGGTMTTLPAEAPQHG